MVSGGEPKDSSDWAHREDCGCLAGVVGPWRNNLR